MKKNKDVVPLLKQLMPWLLIAAILAGVFFSFQGPNAFTHKQVALTDLLAQAEAKQLTVVAIEGNAVTAQNKAGELLVSALPRESAYAEQLVNSGAKVLVKAEAPPSMFLQMFMAWGPTILLLAAWIFFMSRGQKGANGLKKGGGMGNFGASPAKFQANPETTIGFVDVAGCDEAKEEVRELVDFLKDPTKFQKLGGRIPAGVLLSGPPGTGKTLLAKAIAGEAGVPFYSISGSNFVEMFVGVGASRVRDLFQTARANSPCIIFIDEIDAVGRHRGTGTGGGNDEREQTLNQMLVEMDGFDGETGIIVVAATNRPDVLDPALLRPGRFDRQVTVGLPDVRGREQILQVHLRKVPLAADIVPAVLARGTPGFSGADLQNMVNEAALFAARDNKRFVDMVDFERAKDKLMMGTERTSVRMPEAERLSTAYHEAGHAVLAKLLPTADPVHKVSIVPRGRALGVTVQLPENDRYSLGKKRILDTIVILFGGRLAEEIFTDDITTGASNDYERANAMARNLVSRWGMSEALGPLVVGEAESEPFLGRSVQRRGSVSEDTLRKVDIEVRAVLEQQYERARTLLLAHTHEVEVMTAALMKWETIDADQVNDVMAGREVRPPKDYKAPQTPEIVTAPAAA